MTRQGETYYEILGVPRDASARDITASYRKLAKVLHPDVCTSPDAEELFKSINEAYQTLHDVKKREEYDASLAEAGDSPYREYYQGGRRYRDPRTWYYTYQQTGSGRGTARSEGSMPQQPVSAIPRYIQVILFYLTLLMGVLIIAQLFLIPWIGGMNAAGAREALIEGNRWMEEREFQKAIESYESATARLPSFSEAWRAKGLAEVQKADELTSLGQSGEAYYREAIRSLGRVSDQEDIQAKKGIARSLMMTGEPRRALSVLTSIPRESADTEVTRMITEVNNRIHPGTQPLPSP